MASNSLLMKIHFIFTLSKHDLLAGYDSPYLKQLAIRRDIIDQNLRGELIKQKDRSLPGKWLAEFPKMDNVHVLTRTMSSEQ
jgi:hypothetical protein